MKKSKEELEVIMAQIEILIARINLDLAETKRELRKAGK